MSATDRLNQAIDRLGWTSMSDQDAYNDALWQAMKAVRDAIVELRLGTTETTKNGGNDA